MSGRGQDLATVISGLQQIAGAAARTRQAKVQNFLKHSSLKNVSVQDVTKPLQGWTVKDVSQRTVMVLDNSAVFTQVYLLLEEFLNPFLFGLELILHSR